MLSSTSVSSASCSSGVGTGNDCSTTFGRDESPFELMLPTPFGLCRVRLPFSSRSSWMVKELALESDCSGAKRTRGFGCSTGDLLTVLRGRPGSSALDSSDITRRARCRRPVVMLGPSLSSPLSSVMLCRSLDASEHTAVATGSLRTLAIVSILQ